MKYVLDASVAASWVLRNPLQAKALKLRAEYQQHIHELIAPSHFRMKSLKTIGIRWDQVWPAEKFWQRYDKGEFK